MKTNIIMQSQDRTLFGVTIRQETKTGFLNLSDLQQSYENQRSVESWSEKRIDWVFTHKKENFERVYYILKEQGIINDDLSSFIENVDNHGGFFKYMKFLGVYKTTGARQTKTTWCNPYLWMLAAIELHPIIYAKAVIWLTDKLIINRIEAGNMYKGLTSAVSKFNNIDWVKLAKGLNYVVFGRHETGIRNTATQKDLKNMENLERQLAFSIEMGYIKSFDELIEALRKLHGKKLAA